MTIGCVHGRFQPFHNAHLDYVLAAKRECSYLLVGITKYDLEPIHMNPLGMHREQSASNPLSYYERTVLMREALKDAGVVDGYEFVPFPIETPSALPQFVPKNVLCYTTICEEWNRQKIKVLESAGYVVKVLWEKEPKVISARAIRAGILEGAQEWRKQVPPATERAVARLNLQSRLLDLVAGRPRHD